MELYPLVIEALGNTHPKTLTLNGVTLDVWESIRLPEGYEKPPKEEFEAKLQELIDAQPLKELRTKRNTLLEQTDRYATLDYPYATEDDKQSRLTQRQTLRDLPSTTEDPANPVWPTAPTS